MDLHIQGKAKVADCDMSRLSRGNLLVEFCDLIRKKAEKGKDK